MGRHMKIYEQHLMRHLGAFARRSAGSPKARSQRSRRAFILLTLSSLLIGGHAAFSPTLAMAAGCNGSKTQSGVFGGVLVACANGANGLPASTPGDYRRGAQYPNMPCNYRNNPAWPSNYGVLLMRVGRSWHYVSERGAPRDPNGAALHCMRPAQAQTNQQQVALYVPKPVITSNYSEKFLYNAPVTFSIDVNNANKGPDGIIRKEIPGFRGIVSFAPQTVDWDFGDGTKATGLKVDHTFLSGAKEGKIHVTATVTWHAELSLPGERAENARDLGTQQAVAELEHPIYQVHATPTDPSTQ